MQKIMRDIPNLESPPTIDNLEGIPNRGKIYYGEDLQMINLLKKRYDELKTKDLNIGQLTEKIIEWLE